MSSTDDLATFVTEHAPVLVLTGAGMSTASGLPDYRGPQGLWRNRRFEELASIDMWNREPLEFWDFYRMRLDALRHAHPNRAHEVLAELERAGMVSCVVTQNVDGLHSAAGSTTIEVHGSLEMASCLACSTKIPMDAALALTDSDGIPRCSCDTPLKPDVVLFGEVLPPAIEEAVELARNCSAMLVLGTSLKVEPVASIVGLAAAHGAAIAIVNKGVTGADDIARVRVDADLVETLDRLARHVFDATDS